MDTETFREQMMSFREATDNEAKLRNDPYFTLDKLHSFYTGLEHKDQLIANNILCEWALSQDNGLRFDALVLIGDLKITTALPALRELATQLASSSAPSAPYELRKVTRIIEQLIPSSYSDDSLS